MKPHPRPPIIRKTIKWGGAVLTVLLVVVWIGSGWYWIAYPSSANTNVGVEFGRVWWTNEAWHPTGILWHRQTQYGSGMPVSFTLDWWPRYTRFALGNSSVWAIHVPLWMPTALCALMAGVAWRLDILAHRRERLSRCPKCNYDRAGLAVGSLCPECGTRA